MAVAMTEEFCAAAATIIADNHGNPAMCARIGQDSLSDSNEEGECSPRPRSVSPAHFMLEGPQANENGVAMEDDANEQRSSTSCRTLPLDTLTKSGIPMHKFQVASSKHHVFASEGFRKAADNFIQKKVYWKERLIKPFWRYNDVDGPRMLAVFAETLEDAKSIAAGLYKLVATKVVPIRDAARWAVVESDAFFVEISAWTIECADALHISPIDASKSLELTCLSSELNATQVKLLLYLAENARYSKPLFGDSQFTRYIQTYHLELCLQCCPPDVEVNPTTLVATGNHRQLAEVQAMIKQVFDSSGAQSYQYFVQNEAAADFLRRPESEERLHQIEALSETTIGFVDANNIDFCQLFETSCSLDNSSNSVTELLPVTVDLTTGESMAEATSETAGVNCAAEAASSCEAVRLGEKASEITSSQPGTSSEAAGLSHTIAAKNASPSIKQNVRTMVMPSGLTISLARGQLASLRTDVIVSTNCGSLAKNIEGTTGVKFSNHAKTNTIGAFVKGPPVAVPLIAGLPCKEVLLVHLPQYLPAFSGKALLSRELFDQVMACLDAAHAAQQRCIAFPPLGVGKAEHCYPADVCAGAMFDALVEWSSKNLVTSLRVVQIVFPHGSDPFATFEQELAVRCASLLDQKSLMPNGLMTPSTPKGFIGMVGQVVLVRAASVLDVEDTFMLSPHAKLSENWSYGRARKCLANGLSTCQKNQLTSTAISLMEWGSFMSNPYCCMHLLVSAVRDLVAAFSHYALQINVIVCDGSDYFGSALKAPFHSSQSSLGSSDSSSIVEQQGKDTSLLELKVYGTAAAIDLAKQQLDQLCAELFPDDLHCLVIAEQLQLKQVRCLFPFVACKFRGGQILCQHGDNKQLVEYLEEYFSSKHGQTNPVTSSASATVVPRKRDVALPYQWFVRSSASENWLSLPSNVAEVIERARAGTLLPFAGCSTAMDCRHHDAVNDGDVVRFDFVRQTIFIANQVRGDFKRRVLGDRLPIEWISTMEHAVHRKVWLSPDSAEYATVLSAVRRHSQKEIAQIVRIENPTLYVQYLAQKDKLERTLRPGITAERNLFHGLPYANVDSVCERGFDRSMAGNTRGTVYGNGSYFASQFDYSANSLYAQDGHVLYCRVLTGEYVLGNSSLKSLPAKPGTNGLCYDSAVNSMTAPTVFVIFADSNAYPAYLISLRTNSTSL